MSRLRSANSLHRLLRTSYKSSPSFPLHISAYVTDDSKINTAAPSLVQLQCFTSSHFPYTNLRSFASANADGQSSTLNQRTSEALAVLKVPDEPLMYLLALRADHQRAAACKAWQAQGAVATGV